MRELAHNFPDSVNETVAAKRAADALLKNLENNQSISAEALQEVQRQFDTFSAVEPGKPKNVETFLHAMETYIKWTAEERQQVQEALLSE